MKKIWSNKRIEKRGTYHMMSYEEFVERCNRGEVIGGNKRYTDFFYVNPESMTAEIEKYDEQRK